jgi:predicted neuraminidase
MVRYLIILLTILLYLIPYYQNHLINTQGRGWGKMKIADYNNIFSFNDKPFYSEDFVYKATPNTMCHVSSICPIGNNKMACTWYAGSREGAEDVAIYFSIFDEEKAIWTNTIVLVDREQCSKELNRYIKKVGNSLIFNDKNGRLWLFYVSIVTGGWSGSTLNYKVSSDGGHTWSKSQKMVLSPFFNLTDNVKNKGVNFYDGSFLLPVYHEFIKKFSQLVWVRPGENAVHYEIRKMSREKKAIQPSLLHTGEKDLSAFFRNMASGERNYILMAYSKDLGQTWSELKDTPLPNPNSGFDMIKLSDGAYLGVINDSFHDRSNLTIVISCDEGKTWKSLKILEYAPGRKYAYPSINRSDRGFYHITYTYESRGIKHVVFNEAWIKQLNGYCD